MKLRELLKNESQARDFLFDFMRNHLELSLKYEFMTWVERFSERGEKFKTARVIEDDSKPTDSKLPIPQPPPLHIRTAPAVSAITSKPIECAPTMPSPPEWPDEKTLVLRVKQFFYDEIDFNLWQDVCRQISVVMRIGGGTPPITEVKVLHSQPIDAIVRAYQPQVERTMSYEVVNDTVEWLIGWLSCCTPEPSHICRLVYEGFGAAAQEVEQRQGTRYISDSWGIPCAT